MITRSQVRSRQPLDLAASPRANPPRRADTHPSGIPQQPSSHEGGVRRSKRAVGGRSATSLAEGNETPSAVRNCRSDCLSCPSFVREHIVTSYSTGRKYTVVDIDPKMVHCKLQNYIYLLTCTKCFIQYVGESVITVNRRMNIHRRGKTGCEILIDHFTNVCSGSSFTIQILEKLPGNGYSNGVVDHEMRKYRLEREDYWIKTLRTVYPYGLNEKTKSMNSDVPIGQLFPSLPRHGVKYVDQRTRTHRNSTSSHSNLDTLLSHLETIDIHLRGNATRKILDGFKQKHLRKLAKLANERLDNCNESSKRWLDLIIDTYFTKVYKDDKTAKTKKPPKYVLPIYFDNKGLEFIRLSNILRDNEVTSNLPEVFINDETPSVVYRLGKTIRNKILNYKDTVHNIDTNDQATFGTNIASCSCSSSPFVDQNHGHILTGDLRIIKNEPLRKLIQKGPNFREPHSINWKRCRKKIEEGLDICTSKYVSLCSNLTNDSFVPWKNEVLRKVDSKIRLLRQKIKFQKSNPVLKRPDVVNYLRELHENFVLVPIDKASSNIAIICKRFYVELILREIGHIGDGNNTYVNVQKPKEEIVNENAMYSERAGFKVDEREKDLPIMYWIPKMHKVPTAARFIIASKQCSTKPISKSVSNAFKLIFHQIQNFHKKAKFLKNYNKFWVLQNIEPVLEIIKKINRKKSAKSIATYDFSTLYTKIPHNKLVNELHNLINFTFEGGDRNYIKINKWGKASWGKKSKYSTGYTLNSLKMAVKHLIENCFFTVGNVVMRQAIGIPMGIDPAPFWANLFLYVYENQFISDLISTDKVKARHFLSTKRFIDDLCALNDGGEFGRLHQQIYPDELELKVEHSGSHASFLNLDITIKDGIFVYKLYDKRDAFPFSIVRMPYTSSNIPENIFYSAMVGEFLRIARSTLLYEDFLPRVTELIQRLNKQGAKKHLSTRNLRKIIHRHPNDFSHFGVDAQDILTALIH